MPTYSIGYSTNPLVTVAGGGAVAPDNAVLYWDADTHQIFGSADFIFNPTLKQIVLGSGVQLLLPDGAAAAPSLAFSADTGTGMYRPGSQSIYLRTASTNPKAFVNLNPAACSMLHYSAGGAWTGFGASSNDGVFRITTSSTQRHIFDSTQFLSATPITWGADITTPDVGLTRTGVGQLSLSPGSQLLLPNGSAAAPSLSFSNFNSTGTYTPVADGFSVSTVGSERFRVSSAAIRIRSDMELQLHSGTNMDVGSPDVRLVRDAANTLAQRNGTNGQTFRLYSTFTDDSNYRRGILQMDSGNLYIKTENAGTGGVGGIFILPATGATYTYQVSPNNTATYSLGDSTHFWASSYFGGAAASIPITVRAHAAQTANLQEWQNSSGTALASVTKDGYFFAPFGTETAPSFTFTGIANSGLYSAGYADNLSITTSGTLRCTVDSLGITLPVAEYLGFGGSATADTKLYRDGAAGILAQRNGTNAQEFRVYKTYTDGSNYGRLALYGSGIEMRCALQTAGTGTNILGLRFEVPTGGYYYFYQAGFATFQIYHNADAAVFSTSGNVDADLGNSSIVNLWRDLYIKRSIYVIEGTAAAVPIVVKAHASQTANLQEWQNSSGTPLSSITKDGYLLLSNGTVAAPSLSFSNNTSTGFFYDPIAAGVVWTYFGVAKAMLSGDILRFGSDETIEWSNNTDPSLGASDVVLRRAGAGQLKLQGDSANTKLIVKAKASSGSNQTSNLQEWQDGSGLSGDGIPLAYVDACGYLSSPDLKGIKAAQAGSGGRSMAQSVTNIIGSLAVTGSLQADTIYCRRIKDIEGMPYAGIHGTSINWTQASAVQNQWYDISDADIVTGVINPRITHSQGTLTIENDGRSAGIYQFGYSINVQCNSASKHIWVGVDMNGTVQSAGQNYIELPSPNVERPVSSQCLLDVPAGATLKVAVKTSDTGTPDITVQQYEFVIVKIAG